MSTMRIFICDTCEYQDPELYDPGVIPDGWGESKDGIHDDMHICPDCVLETA